MSDMASRGVFDGTQPFSFSESQLFIVSSSHLRSAWSSSSTLSSNSCTCCWARWGAVSSQRRRLGKRTVRRRSSGMHSPASSLIPLNLRLTEDSLPYLARLHSFDPIVPATCLRPIPDARHRVPEVRDAAPDVLGAVPDAMRFFPDLLDHLPEVWRHVPELWHPVPEVRRLVPEVRHRSPEVWRRVPELWHPAPEARRRVPERWCPVPEVLGRAYKVLDRVQDGLRPVQEVVGLLEEGTPDTELNPTSSPQQRPRPLTHIEATETLTRRNGPTSPGSPQGLKPIVRTIAPFASFPEADRLLSCQNLHRCGI